RADDGDEVLILGGDGHGQEADVDAEAAGARDEERRAASARKLAGVEERPAAESARLVHDPAPAVEDLREALAARDRGGGRLAEAGVGLLDDRRHVGGAGAQPLVEGAV